MIVCITYNILCDTYAADCITAYLCPILGATMKKEEAPADGKVFHLRMAADLFERSQALAKRRGISLAGLVRMLLIKELDTEKASNNE